MIAARRRDLREPYGGDRSGGGAGWKRAQRARDELTAAGLLAHGTPTPEGRRLVRGWTWPFHPHELAEAVERIEESCRLGWCRRGELVPETFVGGFSWGEGSGGPAALLQALLIPALADQWLKAPSTCLGQTFYCLATDDLETAIEESVPPEGHELVDDLCETYGREYVAEWKRIMSDSDRYQEITIPEPVGVGLDDESRDYNDCPFPLLLPEPEAASDD